MRSFAVIAERLAVVAGDDDQDRPVPFPHVVKERGERRVGGGHLAVVRLRRVFRVVWGRRFVGRVRIENMDPYEPGAVRALPRPVDNPAPGQADNLSRRPLGHRKLGRRARLAEVVVVQIERLIESEPRVQREGAEERGGGVPGSVQQRRRGAGSRAKAEAARRSRVSRVKPPPWARISSTTPVYWPGSERTATSW